MKLIHELSFPKYSVMIDSPCNTCYLARQLSLPLTANGSSTANDSRVAVLWKRGRQTPSSQ